MFQTNFVELLLMRIFWPRSLTHFPPNHFGAEGIGKSVRLALVLVEIQPVTLYNTSQNISHDLHPFRWNCSGNVGLTAQIVNVDDFLELERD